MTKERPILMHGRSVRGILEGRKTQTRRVIKPQPDLVPMGPAPGLDQMPDEGDAHYLYNHCPYGQPGDVLWVREAKHG